VLSGFPAKIRGKIGRDIMRLQLGEKPLSSRPMPSIGKGVFELRQADDRGWYRVIYLQRIANRLYVLHSLIKKSARTPANDLKIASQRLKVVRERLNQEKRDDQDAPR
jgi:phage-related protein